MHLNLLVFLQVCLLLSMRSFAQDTTFTPHPGQPGLIYMDVLNRQGMVICSGRLLNGKREGVFRWYNDRNTIVLVKEFHEDIPDGIALEFGDNGAVEVEENYRNGQLEGKRVLYRFGGIKRSVEYFVQGKLDGLKTVYYDNGFKQEEAGFKNGMREGVTKWYNQSEQVTIEYSYRKGVLDGPATTYFPHTGKPETIGQYLNGNEHGEWKKYDANGNHIESLFYDNGTQIRAVKY